MRTRTRVVINPQATRFKRVNFASKMIYLSPVEPSVINPFTLSNDMNVLLWHSLLKKMNKAKKALVVTGAGISVEAGIPV
jgi:hypothetical protein